jgi:hypothetical protein
MSWIKIYLWKANARGVAKILSVGLDGEPALASGDA